MMRRVAFAVLFAVVSVVPEPGVRAADADGRSDTDGLTLFETRIRPLLVQHCYRCHSGTTASPESGLRLDTREGLLTGGDRGPAIVPGHPEESLLLSAISHIDPDLTMPPKKERLPKAAIEDVRRWIELGVPIHANRLRQRHWGRWMWSRPGSSGPIGSQSARPFPRLRNPTGRRARSITL